jgi:drug/metabolite transporter (DMT)-like permease
MLLIVRPGMDGSLGKGLGWSALLPIICLLFSSMFQVLSSHLGRYDKPATTSFYSSWIGLICASIIAPAYWIEITSLPIWGLMVLMGVFGALGHFVLSIAYQRAPASSLMPYLYAQVGFAVLGGFIVFGHVPDFLASIGIVVITVSGVANTWYAIRKKRKAAELPL